MDRAAELGAGAQPDAADRAAPRGAEAAGRADRAARRSPGGAGRAARAATRAAPPGAAAPRDARRGAAAEADARRDRRCHRGRRRRASKTPAESYANLLTHATADGVERARIEVVTGVQPVVRSEVSLEDYHIPKKRSWVGIVAAVIVIGALAAGGYLLWQRLALARSAKDLSPATSAAGTVAGNPDPTPVRVDSVTPAAPPKPAPARRRARPRRATATARPPAPAPAAAPAPAPEEDLGAAATEGRRGTPDGEPRPDHAGDRRQRARPRGLGAEVARRQSADVQAAASPPR